MWRGPMCATLLALMLPSCGSATRTKSVALAVSPAPRSTTSAPNSTSAPASDGGASSATSRSNPGTLVCPKGGFAWPNGAIAAVSLTYDDALPSQLDNAIPVLDARGIHATFFLSQTWWQFEQNKQRFAALVAKGHELGSHTVHHPCDKQLAAQTLETMASELDENIQTLRSLGMSGALSFAYPCGATKLGTPPVSYAPLVHARFVAGRTTVGAVADPRTVDLDLVPSMFADVATATGPTLVAMAEQARTRGGWGVIGFHGVGENSEYLKMPQAAHDALVEWLSNNATTVWTAPFGTVAAYVARCR